MTRKTSTSRWLKIVAIASLAAVGLAVLLAAYLAFRFLPERAVTYDTLEDHFKYGSTRGDLATGVPNWIWHAMPLVCADDVVAVAGDRLAPGYLDRVENYAGGDEAEARLALSREGYKALGFLYEKDADGAERLLPVGLSQRRSLGLDRTYINCAVCHTSTYRTEPGGEATLVPGMPANLFNLYDFEHFIFRCGKNRGFSQLEMLPEIERLGADLDLLDQYVVYTLAVWGVKDALAFLENAAGFSVRQPDWGPGRNDTFTNNKIYLYGYPWREEIPDWWTTGRVHPENMGTVDFPSTWLQAQRRTRSDGRPMRLHWDGNNDKVEERNLNAALATSALPPIIDHESVECFELYLDTLEPPEYPFPVDAALAEQGRPIYASYCAECHGASGRDFTGKYVGFVVPIDEIGTDRYRLDNYTETLAINMGTTYAGQERRQREHPCPGGTTYVPPDEPVATGEPGYGGTSGAVDENTYRYQHYRKTNGYANSPLDGVWLRAPYLHNGSVPSLRALLEPSENRPAVFYRGNDLYDPVDVGFVSTVADDTGGRKYFEFDVTVPGNGNQGHEGPRFGTELPPEQKQALIEYLKTF